MTHGVDTEQMPTVGISMSEKLNPSVLIEKLRISPSMAIDFALYAGIGFVSGFLIKRFAPYLVALAIFCIVLVFLQESGILMIHINWDQIIQMLGIQVTHTSISTSEIIPIIWEWIRTNIGISISLLIGFLVGLQAG
jgi:uncharacterized membrane protein (Fun14 family)